MKKLEKRSKKLMFVGYAPNGYRLWDEIEMKIIITRDVIFQEERKVETESKNKKRLSLIINENKEKRWEDVNEGNIIQDEERRKEKNMKKKMIHVIQKKKKMNLKENIDKENALKNLRIMYCLPIIKQWQDRMK